MAVTTGVSLTDNSLLNGNKLQDQVRPDNFVFSGLLEMTWMDGYARILQKDLSV